jgi:DDE superfamily endonuclease
VLSYRVRLDVPRELVLFVSGLLAERRRELKTRNGTRKLGTYRHALFALAWLRDRPGITRLGAGFGLSQATACRYLDEAVTVLAARAPGLREQLERALAGGAAYVILDGKIFPADQCATKTPSRRDGTLISLWYSGKKRAFGGNVQAVFLPDGRPLWVSDVLPGNDNDLTAYRELVYAALLPLAGRLPVLADAGYEQAGHPVIAPVRKHKTVAELSLSARTRNQLIRSVRCRGERGFALLTQRWKTLQHITASPSKIGQIVKAALVLTLFEHKMLH